MMEWLAMGGYAAYVWPVVGVFVLMLAGISVIPSVMHKKVLKQIAEDIEAAKD